jgi:hypothetical protein
MIRFICIMSVILLIIGCGTAVETISIPNGKITVVVDDSYFIGVNSGIIAKALYPHIYLRSGVSLTDGQLAHETLHCERQLAMGVSTWESTYVKSSSFRLTEELYGYRKQLDVDFPAPDSNAVHDAAWIAADSARNNAGLVEAHTITLLYNIPNLNQITVLNQLLSSVATPPG